MALSFRLAAIASAVALAVGVALPLSAADEPKPAAPPADVKAVEQVSAIQFWYRNNGEVSERGSDSPHPNVRGIADEKGRLMVIMAHNTDIPDTWEREGENQQYFERFSPNGYAVGVNIVLYAYTH